MNQGFKALAVGGILGVIIFASRPTLAEFRNVKIQKTAEKRAEKEGLDVNDVSVLFPLDINHKPVPSIRLDSKVVSGALLDLSVFEQLLNYGTSTATEVSPPEGVSSFDALSDWYVMGFRYDPCAPDDANPNSGICMQELRLVAQPLAKLGPADSALHIIYTLGSGTLNTNNPVLRDLLQLKRESVSILKGLQTTSGRPLGIHPLLQFAYVGTSLVSAEESRRFKEVPELYKNFVLKYASSENLTQFTMMGLRNGSFIDWVFFGGHIFNHQWSPGQIPNTPQVDSPFIEFSRLPSRGIVPHQVTPTPLNPELSTALLLDNKPRLIQRNPTLTQELSRAVHSIENPHLTTRNSVDCLSCHSATSLRVHPEAGIVFHIPGLTYNIPYRITAFADIRTLQFSAATWNLRSFGYFTQQPSLSMRSVNESGMAAEQVNEVLGLQPPGKDCSKVQLAVMKCFIRAPETFASSDSFEACLKACAD